MKSIYDKDVADELVERIGRLTAGSKPLWGKMDVAQMLAHCHVPFEMVFPERTSTKFKMATGLKRWILKKLIKPMVVGEKPFKKNGPTAPEFRIADQREFEAERDRVIESVRLACEKGPGYFEQLESPSFGPMTAGEWSNTFYKHTDHHLQQFGV